LRVFGAAIQATSRFEQSRETARLVDETYFRFMLDPTSVSLAEGVNQAPAWGKAGGYRTALRAASMQPEVEEAPPDESQNQPGAAKKPPKPVPLKPYEFYETEFEVRRPEGQTLCQLDVYLLRYGQKKIAVQSAS
jgi:hypothetical protein